MKTFTILTYLSALLNILPFLRPTDRSVVALLWPFKMIVGGLSPILGLIGGLAAAIGLVRRDWKLMSAGLVGAGAAAKLVQSVPDSHAGFRAAFGPDWESHLPESLKTNLAPQRWSPLVRAPHHVTWERDIVYGKNAESGAALLADIWQPLAGAGRSRLCAIYVHGGGWRIGAKDRGTRPFFRRLARQGHVIMDVTHTLWPEGDIPTMVSEVQQAMRWMKQHSADYDIDPERIVLMGGSAGGHLALLTAFAMHHPELQPPSDAGDLSVRGVVTFYPPTDLRTLHEGAEAVPLDGTKGQISTLIDKIADAMFMRLFMLHHDDVQVHSDGGKVEFRGFLAALLGGTPDEIPETYALLSPITHIGPHCPPTLLLQGSDDVFELTAPVRRFHQELRRADVPAILVEFPHTEHGFDLILPQISPTAQAAFYDVERFLALLV